VVLVKVEWQFLAKDEQQPFVTLGREAVATN